MYTHLKEIGSFINTVFFRETERKSYNLTFKRMQFFLSHCFRKGISFFSFQSIDWVWRPLRWLWRLKTLIYLSQHVLGYAILFGTRTTILGLCVEQDSQWQESCPNTQIVVHDNKELGQGDWLERKSKTTILCSHYFRSSSRIWGLLTPFPNCWVSLKPWLICR